MCGIFAYIGPRNPAKICLKGLKALEYRGYDSSGIAGLKKGKILSHKEPGKVQVLEKTLGNKPLRLDLAIAHTRWATHGAPSQQNAHPHVDEFQNLAIVHNGIIENYSKLKKILEEKGIHCRSETDTEVLAHWISMHYNGDLLQSVQQALKEVEGAWALAIIHKNHPDQIIACARINPLIIGFNSEGREAFVSSDVNALTEKNLDIFYLHSDEIAVVKADRIDVYDQSQLKIEKITQRLGIENFTVTKSGYDHYMLKEICEQPNSLRKCLSERIDFTKATPVFDEITDRHFFDDVNKVVFLGCGTSWHAGCLAALLVEEFAQIPAQAEIGSEFQYKHTIIDRHTLVIAISQSGETRDTLSALSHAKAKGAKTLGICNVLHSMLTREVDYCLQLKAGPEISVCSTKAFTSQLSLLFLITLLLAKKHMSKDQMLKLLQDVQSIPQAVEKVLLQKEKIAALSKKYSTFENFIFLGRHAMYFTGLEAALKLKEITYFNASGYAGGELKHGTLALVDPNVAVIALCGSEATFDKLASNVMEVKARGATVLAFIPEGKELPAAHDLFFLPPVSSELSSIVYSIAAQLFAYYIANEKGREIDQPRNLAKSVTVE
jgi:glutamine---fructose-6-phosphate transaminase (isomerizing)